MTATFAVLAAALAVVLVASTVRVVDQEHRLVVRRRGRLQRTHGPGLGYVVPLLEDGRSVDLRPRRRWAAAAATTADGAEAHLRLEFTMQVTNPLEAPEDSDTLALEAVEDAIRTRIGALRVAGLPSAWESAAGWVPRRAVAGVLIDHPVVLGADVAVTGELRRLVADVG